MTVKVKSCILVTWEKMQPVATTPLPDEVNFLRIFFPSSSDFMAKNPHHIYQHSEGLIRNGVQRIFSKNSWIG